MCYHNSLIATTDEIEKRFGAIFEQKAPDFQPIYHASGFSFPLWPVLTAQQPTQLQYFRWGLIPSWVRTLEEAKDLRAHTLNARVETLEAKPSFKYALQNAQRCLVPSTGFYEWHTAHKKKFPYFIHLPQYPLFSMGGLWETWQNPANKQDMWHTFSIITTAANPLMAHIHNTKKRMPLVLYPEQEKAWLYGEIENKAIDENQMKAYTVGRLVGNQGVDTNIPTINLPVAYDELTQQQTSLF